MKIFSSLICFSLFTSAIFAQTVTRSDRGFTLDNGDIHTRVQFLTDDIVRVEKSPTGEYN